MWKKISNIGLILIFIIGFIILIYPKLSNYYNSLVNSYGIGKYEKEIEKIDKVDLNSIFEKAENYNKNLLENPTGIKSGEPKDKNYLSQLKIKEDEEIIGSIIIDKINVKLPIYHGTAEPILQSGVGHLEGTTLPIGGVGMHSVLTGHTGLPSAKLFTDLEKVKLDDLIVIKVLDKTLTYKVRSIEVVLPKEVENLRPVKNKDLITLVTCTPYGVNSHRLLVNAERIENPKIEEQATVTAQKEKQSKKGIIIFGALGILCIIGGYFIIKKYRKK